ncbi:aldo/keto reductase [Rhizobium sp. LEGMi135b]
MLGEAGFRVEAVQNHYSLLYRSSQQAVILDYCRNQGIPFFAYVALERGVLTGRYSPENPLPKGSSREEVYNGMLPQLRPLTNKLPLEQFQEKCTAVFRPELRENKELERFRDSVKS